MTLGDNDVVCLGLSQTTPSPNCYSGGPPAYFGVLSTSDTAYDKAYGATTGWDFATGIGTVNVNNLLKELAHPQQITGQCLTLTATSPVAASGVSAFRAWLHTYVSGRLRNSEIVTILEVRPPARLPGLCPSSEKSEYSPNAGLSTLTGSPLPSRPYDHIRVVVGLTPSCQLKTPIKRNGR